MERKAVALRRLCWLQFNTKMSQILLDLFYRSESFLADGKQRLVQECFFGKTDAGWDDFIPTETVSSVFPLSLLLN